MAGSLKPTTEPAAGGKLNWWIHKAPIHTSDISSVDVLGEPSPFERAELKRAVEWECPTYDAYIHRSVSEGYLEWTADPRIKRCQRMILNPTAKYMMAGLGEEATLDNTASILLQLPASRDDVSTGGSFDHGPSDAVIHH